MKIDAFIPIKSYSERVKGKNFLVYKNKELYKHIIEKAVSADCFNSIYVDTDSDAVKNFSIDLGCKVIDREPYLATNYANGNDLMNYWCELIKSDFYFQLFATSPDISTSTIKNCVKFLIENYGKFDSILTVEKYFGWFWYNKQPVTYIPNILPRSQDVYPIYQETTALYGICRDSLLKYKCRIGAKPFFYETPKSENLDIDWPSDII